MDEAAIQREKILHGYRKATGQPVPFMILAMKAADIQEAYDLMEAAIKTGKPVSQADIDRLSPEYPEGVNIL